MQLIVGKPLNEVASPAGERIGLALRVGVQAADALHFAHGKGVVHRDVKPPNILLDESGTAWVTDFGLARHDDDPTLTQAGALMGTPRYMSPEQAAAAADLDRRTDVYSLGATLYELLAGRPVYDGKSPHDVVVQVLAKEPSALRSVASGVPRDLETVIAKAMARRREDRYATAGDFADDLCAVAGGRPSRPGGSGRWAGRGGGRSGTRPWPGCWRR